MKLAVQLAYEIIDLYEECERLRYENAKLKSKSEEFDQFVQDSLHAGERTMGAWLQVLTDPNSPVVLGLQAKEKP